MTKNMTGGEAMAMAAKANGIKQVFGIPGAQIYPLFDAFAREDFDVIVPRHEQTAGYMAMGAAKSTGKPSAMAVVPGPGVLNASAALCTAMGNCSEVLCLVGQVPSTYLGVGRGHLHELADQAGTLNSIIKDAVRIDKVEDSSAVMNAAFETMTSGRPGPVSVEMCWDTMAQNWDVDIGAGAKQGNKPELDLDLIKAAAKAISSAKKPMIMCGSGAQDASAEVKALAELLNCPVTAFRSGRGVVAEDHPLSMPPVAARVLWDECDLLIGVGSRLEMPYMRWVAGSVYHKEPTDDRTLVRIEIDQDELDRFVPDFGLLADSADACQALISELESQVNPDSWRRDEIAEVKAKAWKLIHKVQPQMDYLNVIREVLPRDGCYIPELSQMGFATWAGGMPIYEPRTYISEGFQGNLGFGFPTALGVKAANPDRAVVSVTGDGGFMFGMQDLATAAQYGIGLVTLVFNNNSFGNVRRDQQMGFGGRLIGADLVNPDFMLLAESFGVTGYRVSTPEELKPVLAKAIDDDKPALIEVMTETGSEAAAWEFINIYDTPELG
ncbi:MAG: thiamine pyrophosphate-binding protein [Gammaproteobacteria bacterium]|jgi:acetolactate synthase I/II/III large subunit|nr:thiamine pyrophosphate-binding protein [Gammaproteobacteria bacterium]